MRIVGRTHNVEFAQPSSISVFFGTASYVFNVTTENEINIGGVQLAKIPVRIDSYVKVPSFDGEKVEIEGEYDLFDSILIGNSLKCEAMNVKIRAVRRLPAALCVVITVLYVFMLFLSSSYVIAEFYIIANSKFDFEVPTYFVITIQGALLLLYVSVMAYIFLFSLEIIRRIIIPPILTSLDRMCRVVAEYKQS